MRVPMSNCTLVGIAGGGTSEGYRSDPGDDPDKWTGSEPAYLVESVVTPTREGRLDKIKKTYIVIPFELSSSVNSGDTITYVTAGEPKSREVSEIARHQVAGTCRLYFRDA